MELELIAMQHYLEDFLEYQKKFQEIIKLNK